MTFRKQYLAAATLFTVILAFVMANDNAPTRKRPVRITREMALKSALAKSLDQVSEDDWRIIEICLDGENAAKVRPVFEQILRKGPSARFGDVLLRISMRARFDSRAGKPSYATNFVPALAEAYRISDGEMRGKIAETIGDIGPASAPIVPQLIATLRNPAETNAFAYAAQALGKIGKSASNAIPTLQMYTNSPWGGLAFHCADALARIADDPAPYLPLVIRGSEPAAFGVNTVAIDALQTFAVLGPAASNALPVIIHHLEKPNISMTIEPALQAVAALGPLAEPAAPELERIVANSKLRMEVRTNAVGALGKIKGAAYDMNAGLLTATAEWRKLHDAELRSIEHWTVKLPAVTRIEVSALAPRSVIESKKIKPVGQFTVRGDASTGWDVLERKALEGAEAQNVAASWRKLEFGSWFQAACFSPVYGLRFMDGQKVVLETAVCWQCATVQLNDGFEGFDAESPEAQALLETLDNLIPFWTEDDLDQREK